MRPTHQEGIFLLLHSHCLDALPGIFPHLLLQQFCLILLRQVVELGALR